MSPNDRERNRLSARARRYAKVGTQLGGQRVAELTLDGRERLAEEVAAVTEVEETDAEGAWLQVVEHDVSTLRCFTDGLRHSAVGLRNSRAGVGLFRRLRCHSFSTVRLQLVPMPRRTSRA